MKRFKSFQPFQIIKFPRNFYSSSKTTAETERIDSLLANFEESVREMKRFLQNRGYSRRHFFSSENHPKISESFGEKSERFKEFILDRADEIDEWNFCKSILSLGSIYRWKEAEILFKRAKLRFPCSADIFSAMIYAYAKVGEYLEALKIFEEIIAKPSSQINRKMFEGLLEAYSVHVERQILTANALDERNLETNDSIYRQAHLERVLTEISMDPAIRIYNQILELKFTPTISTITRIIRLAGRLKRFDVIEDMQRECERLGLKFDSQAVEVLIFAHMQCGRIEEAEEILNKSFNANIIVDDLSRILNVMLFGYCRLRRPLEANRLLQTFKIEPSPSALSFLCGTAAKCGFIKDAEEFYQKLSKSEGHAENSYLLIPAANHLLSAYIRDDNFERFFELIDQLGPENRDKYTNTLIFDALSRTQDLGRLSKEIEQTKIAVSRKSLSSMELSALFKCLFVHFEGDAELIKDFIRYVQGEIAKDGRSGESRRELQIILLDVFSKQKEWIRCIELVEILLSSTTLKDSALVADPIIFAKLMTAAGPNPEKIEFILNWMRRVKCWRDPAILTAAMELYWQAGCSNESRALWEEIKGRRNKARSFSVAISTMAEILLTEEGPLSALNHLNYYKNLWNDSAVQIYLKSLRLSASTTSQEISNFFFERAIKMNPKPSVNVCNEILISTITKSEIIEKVIDWMCQNGCHPNVQTVNVLLATGDLEKFKFTRKLVDEMIDAGARPSDELLLRMISGQLSLNYNDNSAEKYSKILLDRPTTTPQVKLEIYSIWLKYFEKNGQLEKVREIEEEIKKLK